MGVAGKGVGYSRPDLSGGATGKRPRSCRNQNQVEWAEGRRAATWGCGALEDMEGWTESKAASRTGLEVCGQGRVRCGKSVLTLARHIGRAVLYTVTWRRHDNTMESATRRMEAQNQFTY